MATVKNLEYLASLDVKQVDIDSLTDLRGIQIDTKAPVTKKMESFLEQTNNPYIHRIGDYVVKVVFQKTGPTLDDRIGDCIRHMTELYLKA